MTVAAPARTSRPGSPFSDVQPDVGIALGGLLMVVLWIGVDGLPGGRWLAVHLFTLGIVTPLIVAFSQHQAETVLRVPPRSRTAIRSGLVGGALLLAAGMAFGWTPAIAVGATASTGAVLISYRRLRRARKQALGARFAWLARAYERAHGAFVHGAVLGLAMGVGLVPGWAYLATRTAHLHAMVLGFAGVTLLATVVLYGPTLLRAQLEPGADQAGGRWVGRVATATSVAVLGLLVSAVAGPTGVVARMLAAAALGFAAVGAGAIAVPLVRTVLRKGRDAPAPGVLLAAAIVWLTIGIGADTVVVATARWEWFDTIGTIVLVGALGQAISATLLHVVTSWLPRPDRLAIRGRLDGAPRWIIVAVQLSVVVVVVSVAI